MTASPGLPQDALQLLCPYGNSGRQRVKSFWYNTGSLQNAT